MVKEGNRGDREEGSAPPPNFGTAPAHIPHTPIKVAIEKSSGQNTAKRLEITFGAYERLVRPYGRDMSPLVYGLT